MSGRESLLPGDRRSAVASIDDDTGTTAWRIAALVIAPAVLLAALVAHPYLAGRLPSDDAVAEAVVAGTTRWGLVHLATSVASGLIILAFLALRSYLHEAGEDRHSARGLPFVVIGSTLFAVLPGMEFAPLAAAETGATTAEIAATQDAISGWFIAVLVAGASTFAVGVLSFARAISITTVGSLGLTRIVVAALVVMAGSRFVPLVAAQFYVQGVAAIVALWPLAYAIGTQPGTATRGYGEVPEPPVDPARDRIPNRRLGERRPQQQSEHRALP
jgi:MFS family permease